MKKFSISPTLKGAILGLFPSFLFLPVFIPIGYEDLKISEITDYFPIYILLFVLFVGSASIVGYYSGKLKEKRKRTLLFYTLLIFILDSWIISFIIVMSDERETNFGIQLLDSIKLSLFGSFLFGMILLPMLSALIFVLEKWTRKEE